MKRIFDVILTLLAILILSIPMIIICLLIRLEDNGPVIFKQNRLGFRGKEYKIYKFRTMILNAEKVGTGIYTSSDDPRITKVGRLLRKTSLDELPQLINVLIGDMSIVGPRPPVPYHPYKLEDYTKVKAKRFLVKPGITGLAQVSGRNNLTWDERIEYDIRYVETRNMILDFKIIFLTIVLMVKKDSVYSK